MRLHDGLFESHEEILFVGGQTVDLGIFVWRKADSDFAGFEARGVGELKSVSGLHCQSELVQMLYQQYVINRTEFNLIYFIQQLSMSSTYNSHSLEKQAEHQLFGGVYCLQHLTLYLQSYHYIYWRGIMNSGHDLPYHPPKTHSNHAQTKDKRREYIEMHRRLDFKNQENSRITGLIGFDRLLSSIDRLSPLVDTWNANKMQSTFVDRFIPDRRMVIKNYDRKESLQQMDVQDYDPQNVSISQIFNQEILGGVSGVRQCSSSEQVKPFRNTNILRFGGQNNIVYSQNQENPLGITTSKYHKVRKVNKVPCKVLDAPALQDDFYLNLIDWSSSNQLAVGLGHCIYLWNAETSKVVKLCELQNDLVTSVGWSHNSQTLAIGCNKGEVLIWDVQEARQIRRLAGHDNRVGAVTWNSSTLATGSRDKSILLRDLRVRRDYTSKLLDHSQQICGLKWSIDEQYLASGGNDNKVVVWSAGGQSINKFNDHRAAVKALAWSPQQHGLLASGGGTADRILRLRNVLTGEIIAQKDTGSQICNLAFSKNMHQLVSTHGYSLNEINIWSYPRLKRVATLVGHTHRVLFLAMNPDGSTIVSGAGDETLRFWNIFPPQSATNKKVYKIQDGMNLR